MIETFVIALCSLVVALYVQARIAARKIRNNRGGCILPPAHKLMLEHRR
ncbi:MAG: hypothetical protein ACI8R4_004172 [Paracoccaceae bacterium]|jgi:hypothetical protein